QRLALGTGRGMVQRAYQKIVGSAGARGRRLLQVVHRFADPPTRFESAGGLRVETPSPQLNARCSHGERHVEAVVDEQPGGPAGGQTDGETMMLEPGEGAAARMRGEALGSARCQGAGDVVQVGPTGDAVVRDGVQPGERRPLGARHVKRWPARTPRPRTQSGAVMRTLPAGWISATSTAPWPVAIRNRSSGVCTSPAGPLSSSTRTPNSFTSRPSSSVHAPGLGSRPRITRATRPAGSVLSMRAAARVSLGA